nr:reverse transcriptase domain-containing protein [Tanacetum cinerariifolium]
MTTTEFINYMKANDAILKNMQTNMTSLINSNLELKNMFGQFMKMNSASSSSSRTLPSNTITNPKEDLKGITTRNGIAYKGPTIPTTSSPPKLVECEIDVKKQVKAPVSTSKPNLKPSIPYQSRLNDQKLHEKANDQMEKFFQIFQYLNFNISFADALILMPKFALTIKSLLTNKDKLLELARTPLNEHCSAGMHECLALVDHGASINLMPLSVWKKLSLPKLSPTCMTLELADRAISRPVGVAKDVSVKVGKFHFSADFVVVDFDADPRVPLILRRSFLKTVRALIDVYKGELTLCVGNKAVTFNLDQTSRYSFNYDDILVYQINVIDVAYEKYSQEVLGFSVSGNPTPSTKPIVSTSSPTLTPFEFLNDDPLSPPILSQELIVVEPKNEKSSIDKPPVVEIKDLPPHLEYAFLEGDDKLPVIIAKDLKDEEKTTLIKILMEDDFKLVVQHQRRVNPKIYEVIKKEVLKFLDAELIYPISDSPWVSPVHCVPKKGGFTVFKNKENELIPTRLVTGWRVCIDYQKLNDTTYKDHFPLPFMDQMLERLAGNKYYYFLDGFSGYFQIPIDPQDQEKTTFTCPFTYRRMLSAYEKSHFMVKDGIVVSHKISKNAIEVDKAKFDVITKLPHPTTIKECIEAFQFLKKKLTEAPILVAPDWNLPFELMCDASDFAIDRKPLIFLRLATMDPPGDIKARTTPPKREKSHNVMKCLKMPSKFVRSLTYGASILWGRSRLHEGTNDTKGEDQKTEEEPKGDDQSKEAKVGVPDLVTNKENSYFLQSTSSHSISSNFGNQFLVNSLNASLIGTILEHTDTKITFMMDVKLQQDVALVENEPFHEVKVSVIREPTQQPPSTPPLPATEDLAALVINFEEVDSFIHKFKTFEKDTEEEPKGDDQSKEAKVGVPDLVTNKENSYFLQSTSSHSISSNFGNQFLVNSLNASLIGTILEHTDTEITSMMDVEIQQDVPLVENEPFHEVKVSNIKDELQKVLQSHTEGLKKELTVKKAKYKEFIEKSQDHKKAKERYEHVGLKVTKKESLTRFEVKKIIMKKMKRNQDEAPPARLNQGKETKKRRIRKEAKSSKKSSKSKESTKDWNTVKTINDAPEQPQFNEMINAEKLRLTFDELMSKPIDSFAYAMNSPKLT